MQGHREQRPRPSSFSHHRWSQVAPLHPAPITVTAGPSHSRQEPVPNESARTYRTMALRHMNSYQPKSWSRARRQTISTTTDDPSGSAPRSSRPVSQPVLVRTYSGNTGDSVKPPETNKPPSTRGTPSPRRPSFSFIWSSPSETQDNNGPKLPSPEDFSIESILRTIDPNIQTTLDSIAGIYGRSKLSLANEYESHIAPLGEIRAPPGYLLTVDEASSEQERQQDENGGGADVGVDAVDSCYTSFVPFSVAGDGSSVQAQPDSPRSTPETNPGFDLEPGFEGPVTREFAEGAGGCGRDLLESTTEQRIVTPAVVSEVHLDAQANSQLSIVGHEFGAGDGGSNPSLLLGGLQAFFSRIARYGQSNFCRQSAEVQLRAMLHRDLSAD